MPGRSSGDSRVRGQPLSQGGQRVLGSDGAIRLWAVISPRLILWSRSLTWFVPISHLCPSATFLPAPRVGTWAWAVQGKGFCVGR